MKNFASAKFILAFSRPHLSSYLTMLLFKIFLVLLVLHLYPISMDYKMGWGEIEDFNTKYKATTQNSVCLTYNTGYLKIFKQFPRHINEETRKKKV